MDSSAPGIDTEPFKLALAKEMYGELLNKELTIQVISEPEPFTRENRSRWWVVNWWRKLMGTYYEHGYRYKMKLIEYEPKPGKTVYTIADDDPEKVKLQGPKIIGKIELPEIKKRRK